MAAGHGESLEVLSPPSLLQAERSQQRRPAFMGQIGSICNSVQVQFSELLHILQ